MVKAKYHEGVCVCQDRFINRQLKSRLINALKHGDRMASHLADQLLEIQCGNMEQLERAGDSLQKLRRSPLCCLVVWPGYPPHLRHGRETVVDVCDIPLGFPR